MGRLLLTILLITKTCYGQTIRSFYNGSIEIFYEEQGQGRPLYILTGGPGAPPEYPSHEIMDSLKAFYTCVLLHQRGSGKSRNIPINEQTINIKSYLQDVELLRQKRGDDRISILGIS